MNDYEEEALDLTGTVHKLRDAFDRDRVTKKFYDRFKAEHAAFLKFIKGIADQADREWYASLMLNRLMFVYFIQQRGFLDGNRRYLHERLHAVQALKGRDNFLAFYRYFLLALFHEGFSKQKGERQLDVDLAGLLGEVPYLNGGLFEPHQLEADYPGIEIPDKAFEKLLAFFDEFDWVLDTRPISRGNEINPDVLGYIFEKYINQKQMGAYYTKEDITSYISRNTILPYLLDAASQRCAVAFQPGSVIWSLLKDSPDEYIYPAVRHGVIDQQGQVIPLPAEIERGVNDVSCRGGWNRPAAAKYALPTETWREHIARRQRCIDLRARLAAGEIHQVNDLVTENLNIGQFVQDAIDSCEGPDLLRSLYYAIAGHAPQSAKDAPIAGVSILDNTCGSGAFLFAALNILEPLYAACLDRMQAFVQESETVLLSTPEEELDALIAQGESRTLEFKSTARWDVKQNQASKKMEEVIVKAVAALLNTDGGDLIIGVDDAGRGLGLEMDYKVMGRQSNRDGYENWLTTLLLDKFGKQAAACLRITFVPRHGHEVCRICVAPSPNAVYVADDKAEHLYIRAGNSSRLLTSREAIDYHAQRFHGPRPAPPARTAPTSTRRAGGGKRAAAFADFRGILADAERHPSRDYFILKSIIVRNLYGVDIMEEAVEICKLRLFLKLVSQIERVEQLEPLPDIDFNIRAGNTLVGYTSIDEIRAAHQVRFPSFPLTEVEKLVAQANSFANLYDAFCQRQTAGVSGATSAVDLAAAKQTLRKEQARISGELDCYLAGEYGIDADSAQKASGYAAWRKSHQPFHWFSEFYGIMARGGFDVIIGNPPWKEYSAVKKDYTVRGYASEACGNLHCLCTERSLRLRSALGRMSFIVQLPLVSSSRMDAIRDLLVRSSSALHVIPFDDRPGKLFEGLQNCRSVIFQSRSVERPQDSALFTTRYQRWASEVRQQLFPQIEYARLIAPPLLAGIFPKYANSVQQSLFQRLEEKGAQRISSHLVAGETSHFIFYQEATRYWVKATYGLPYYAKNGSVGAPAHGRYLYLGSKAAAHAVSAVLNSSLFYVYFIAYGDCFHLSDGLASGFPVTDAMVSDKSLASLNKQLMNDLSRHAARKTINTKAGDQITYDEFYVGKSKPIIDEIDAVLARHYGFTDAELDFIINYDIKYRMGQDGEEDDE